MKTHIGREFFFIAALVVLAAHPTRAGAEPEGKRGSKHEEHREHREHKDRLLAPTLTQVKAVSYFEIDLAWCYRAKWVTGFKVERSTDGKHFAQIAQIPPNTTSYRDDGLFPDTRYFYRVRAFTAAKTSPYSNVGSARTPSPPRPLTIAEWGFFSGAPTNEATWVKVAAGTQHSLALSDDGKVTGWGSNLNGESTPPTNLCGVVDIAAGDGHSLALKSDGTVVGWGFNGNGVATPPTNLTGVVAIAAGGLHSLALKADGTVASWGYDQFGETIVPTNLSGAVAIAAGDEHSLALRSDGTVVQWGFGGYSAWAPPTNLANVVAIAAGGLHSLASRRDGTVVSWGQDYGAGGFPTNLSHVAGIATGWYHGVALGKDGTLRIWGYEGEVMYPEGLSGVVAVAAAGLHNVALTTAPSAPSDARATVRATNQLVLSWRDNSKGEQGFKVERKLFEDTNWTQVAVTGPGKTNYTDKAVTADALYMYRVQAFGPFGSSLYCAPVMVRTSPLDAPQSVAAVVGTTNGVNITWSDPFSGVDGFKVERAPDSNGVPGAWKEIGSAEAKIGDNGVGDSTVATNTTYWYRVRAFNVVGFSSYSDVVSVSVVPPSSPGYLTVNTWVDQALLNWGGSSGTVEGYRIERAPDAGGSPGAWLQLTNVGPETGYFQNGGLSLNKTYWYRVRAFNWVGDSPYTPPVDITIVGPATPSSLVAVMGVTNTVELSWSQSPPDQQGFSVERALDAGGGPGAWSEIAVLSISNSTTGAYSDTNVLSGKTYWYRVRAFNVLGYSPYTDAVRVPLMPPDRPTSLTAWPVTDRVNLYWYDASTLVAGYRLERATDADGEPGAWEEFAVVSLPFGNPYGSYTDTNRAADTTYWYRVRAFNWTGSSPYSDAAVVTITPPTPPVSLWGTVGETNQVNLSWQDYSADEDGFIVEWAVDIGGGPGRWTQLATVAARNQSSMTFTHTNVPVNTTNWYRVRAFNVVGTSDYSSAVNVVVAPPPTPSYFYASSYKAYANLSWAEPYNGTVGGFKIERAPDAGGVPGVWAPLATTPGVTTSYADSGLTAGRTYWYRVRAFTWAGESSSTTPAAVTIYPPGPPEYPWAALGTTNSALVSWYDYYGDEDGFKLERAPDAGGVPGTWAQIGVTNTGSLYSTSVSDTNVLAKTTNWYRVVAFNDVGLSDYSEAVVLRAVAPVPPYGLSTSALGTRVNLWWYDDDASIIQGYQVERAPDAGGAPGNWVEVADAPGAGYSYNEQSGGRAWFRVRAYNWIGESPFSGAISVAATPPSASIGGLYGVVGDTNQVDLSWYDYAEDEDGFKIERAPNVGSGPGTWTEIGTLYATNTYSAFFVDTNAAGNTTNWYRVRAFNVAGFSAYGTPASVAVVRPPPPSLSAYPVRDSIVLNFYEYYAQAIAGYEIQRALDAGGGPGTWVGIATNAGAVTYYTDPGRAANTTYWYRVRAVSWLGMSDYSTPASAMLIPPSQPSGLYAYVGTTNQVNLSWYDYTYDEDGFKIERAPDAAGSPGAWTEIATVSATNLYYLYYTDTNVSANTTNWYRVHAYNSVGISDYSGPAWVAVVPPDAPVSLTGTATAAHRIDLYWYPSGGFLDGYKLERAPDVAGNPGNWTQIANVQNGYYYASYSDAAVALNKTYWYRVRAYSWVGESSNCPPIAVRVAVPVAPGPLVAVHDGPNQITVSWPKLSPDSTGIRIERALDLGGTPAGWIEIASLSDPTVTRYTETGRQTGKTYWYRARSSNAVGFSPYSNEASALVRDGQFVRVMQWNIERGLGRIQNNVNYAAQAMAHIVNYNRPDILLLNEVDAQGLSAAQDEQGLIDWVTNSLTYLGTQPGSTFYVSASSKSDGFIRNAAISRFPIAGETTYDDGLRGLHAFEARISDANSLEVFHAHLKCCSDDCARKQSEADFDAGVIAAFAATNSLPYLFAGDWNEEEEAPVPVCTLTGSYHPVSTIRQGAGLAEFKPVNLSGEYRTWSTRNTPPTIRFDYILSATDRQQPVAGYVFNSIDWYNHGMYGDFNYYDSYYASDHYCVVATYFFPAPALVVNPPDALAAAGFRGGPFQPSSVTYTLSNSTAGQLEWTASKTGTWLDLSAAGGTLDAGATATVTLSVNTNANVLANGAYPGGVTFSNKSAGLLAARRSASLTVSDPATLTVTPSISIHAVGALGGPFNPGQQAYTVSNAGIQTLSWTAARSATWLSVSPTNGSLIPGEAATLVVSIDPSAAALAAGVYSDTVSIVNTTSGVGSTTRTVELDVASFGFFDDFSTFSTGNLVGQKGWAQALAPATLPLQIRGGRLVVPSPQTGDNQDAYKNFTLNSGTIFYGMTIIVSNAPAAASPSYFATLYTGNNANGFANFRLSAKDNGGGTYVLAARITGQAGDPYTFGSVGLAYGMEHRVIVEADAGGTTMEVYVDPTGPDLSSQAAYLFNGVGTGSPPAQSGSIAISQFNSSSAPVVGFSIGRLVVVNDFGAAYYSLTPAAQFATSGFVAAVEAERPRLLGLVRSNEDVRIEWSGAGGETDFVQAASRLEGPYSNISPALVLAGTGSAITNYVDSGALTNATMRFYRVWSLR